MNRTLNEYEHVAQREHQCNICGRYIQAGDIYRGIISLIRGRFSIWKEHVHPFCPEEFFDEEKEIMKGAEEQDKREEESVLEIAA